MATSLPPGTPPTPESGRVSRSSEEPPWGIAALRRNPVKWACLLSVLGAVAIGFVIAVVRLTFRPVVSPVSDTRPPTVMILSPTPGTLARTTVIASGRVLDDSSGVQSLQAQVGAGAVVPVSFDGAGNFQFDAGLPLDGRADGPQVLRVWATDRAGNRSQPVTVSFGLDTRPPVITIEGPNSGLKTGTNLTCTGQVTDAGSGVARLQAWVDSGNPVPVAVDTAGQFTFRTSLPLTGEADGPHTVTLRATDRAGNVSSVADVAFTLTTTTPGSVAPPVDPTVTTALAAATQFLYTGDNPIQQGVAPGTINPIRAAVLRGQVRDRDGRPIQGVTITVLNHPEFGATTTRADGMFDLAVNGGSLLTVTYTKAGKNPAQRQVNVPWQDYTWLPDVVMIPQDSRVTTIDLTAATTIQVARGSVQADADGSRQATLLVPQGTRASMAMPDGSTAPLSTLHVHATEYTVGPNGSQAMPAELPPTSGYTYAVELSADEATAAGATTVACDRPLPFYVENFLNFPVGGIVPAGYYDRMKGRWVPSQNGRIIAVLSVTGGLAYVDVDGSGRAADASALATLGIGDAERGRLAEIYRPGQSLWRVPIAHFTPWDCNWPYGPPPGAKPPNQPRPRSNEPPNDQCETCGSAIGVQGQTLGEHVGITGTPFSLHYTSNRNLGCKTGYRLDIPLSGANVPASLRRIVLEVSIAGRRFDEKFAPTPNQSYAFTWDGKDAYGRAVQGAQAATIRIGYVYGAVYMQPSAVANAFGALSGVPITGVQARQEITMWQEWQARLGTWDAQGAGIGGWDLNVHHVYSPGSRVLYFGYGEQRSASSTSISQITTVETGSAPYGSEGGVAVGPDSSLYIAADFTGHNRVRRVGPDGIITTVAGEGNPEDGLGDGGPATKAKLNRAWDVAVGPDGSLYIADADNHRIRRVDQDGIITTVAGTGEFGYGDSGPATKAKIGNPTRVAVGPDGSLYIVDAFWDRIRRVGTDGIITIVAGGGNPPDGLGDGGPATKAELDPRGGVAVGPDSSLYIADSGHNRIRRVGPDGIITTVAGGGNPPDGLGDGGPATMAELGELWVVAVGPDGSLYIADSGHNRIRRVGPDGIITTMAGTGHPGLSGDGGPATMADSIIPGASRSGRTAASISRMIASAEWPVSSQGFRSPIFSFPPRTARSSITSIPRDTTCAPSMPSPGRCSTSSHMTPTVASLRLRTPTGTSPPWSVTPTAIPPPSSPPSASARPSP